MAQILTSMGNWLWNYLKMGTTTVIDSSRNLTNIGTISATGFSTNGNTATFSNSVGSLPLVTSTPYDYTAKFESFRW